MIVEKYRDTFYNPTRSDLNGMIAPVAFDLDSVLNEGGQYLRSSVAKKFGLTVEEIIKRDPVHGYEKFHFNIPGATSREISQAVTDSIIEDSMHYPPSPLARTSLFWCQAFTRLPTVIVTARPLPTVDVTHQWLEKNFFGLVFKLIMVNGMQKEVVLKRIKNELFIDDRYRTIETLEKHISYPVLYKRPWNQGRPDIVGFHQINDLADLPFLAMKIWPSGEVTRASNKKNNR